MMSPYHLPPERFREMLEYSRADCDLVLAMFNANLPKLRAFRRIVVQHTGTDDMASVETLIDRNATVARVVFESYVTTGSSKREPGDVYDPALGEKFAIARAFVALGEAMEDDANEEVRIRCGE